MKAAHRAIVGPLPTDAGHGKHVVLLSLFDGTGMARAGVDDLLRTLGAPDVLRASFCVEINITLSRTVESAWQRWDQIGGGIPHAPIADD
eukprot:4027776-Lingulodinium_polyedra.AAC.1